MLVGMKGKDQFVVFGLDDIMHLQWILQKLFMNMGTERIWFRIWINAELLWTRY